MSRDDWMNGPVPNESARIRALETSNRVLRKELQEIDTKARRSFSRGMFLGGLLVVLGFWAGAVGADTLSISGSLISLEPSDEPGVVAVITFENVAQNGSHDNGDYIVVMPGLAVDLTFTWEVGNFGQDRITIIPPDGMRCEPASCEADVMEGLTGHIRLLEWTGS